jgi:hypothetical protein
VDFEE